MSESQQHAPGSPGIPPRWTSSAKSGVGTAASLHSHVWFTISHGIVNEVYYPRLDQANTRDFGLLVADGSGFFSEEKRHTLQEVVPLAQGVPGYRLTNTCAQGRYRLVKTVLADPRTDVLVQQIQFQALQGRPSDYGVFALLAPHIEIEATGTRGGSASTKAFPCSSPSGTAPPWPWPVRPRSRP